MRRATIHSVRHTAYCAPAAGDLPLRGSAVERMRGAAPLVLVKGGGEQ